jgi:hypothetical protein
VKFAFGLDQCTASFDMALRAKLRMRKIFLMPSTIYPHPELAPKAHVEGRTIDLQRCFPRPTIL